MTTLSLDQRRAIDRAKEDLVVAAEKLLDEAGIKKIDTKRLGDSQFRNLLAVAMETESPMVVVNFIRYQIGRDTRKVNEERGWRFENDGKTLGERFIAAITADDAAVAQALTGVPGLADPKLKQLAKIELIRHFLGFASRYRKFVQTTSGKGETPSGDDE